MPDNFVIGDRGLSAAGDTHPDWTMAHAVSGTHLVVGASAVGQIHLRGAKPRDDAFLIRGYGKWLAVAVADGVGTRPLSRYGATYAVEALTAALLRHFAEPLQGGSKLQGNGPPAPASNLLTGLVPSGTAEDVDFDYGLTQERIENRAAQPLPPESLKPSFRSTVGRVFGRGSQPAASISPSATQLPDGSVSSSPVGEGTVPQLDQVGSVGWWVPTELLQVALSEPQIQVPPQTPSRQNQAPVQPFAQDPPRQGQQKGHHYPDSPAQPQPYTATSSVHRTMGDGPADTRVGGYVGRHWTDTTVPQDESGSPGPPASSYGPDTNTPPPPQGDDLYRRGLSQPQQPPGQIHSQPRHHNQQGPNQPQSGGFDQTQAGRFQGGAVPRNPRTDSDLAGDPSRGAALQGQGDQDPRQRSQPHTSQTAQPAQPAHTPQPRQGQAPVAQSRTDLEDAMLTAFKVTHLGMRERAKELNIELSDLGCTALALLVNRDTGEGVVGQVGDGAILGLTKYGQLKELSGADEGEDPQSTYTVNRPDFRDHLDVRRLDKQDRYTAFFVMTDGVSGDLLYSDDAQKVDKWGNDVNSNLLAASSPAQAAAAMLNWLAGYQVKGSWDDRTLVVITQHMERS